METFYDYMGCDGHMDITDPCYDRGTWCAVWDLEVKPGRYEITAEVVDKGAWGHRVARIMARHEDLGCITANDLTECISEDIGVDAGLCGFFCHKSNHTPEQWYSICTALEPDDSWIHEQIPEGLFTSSGYGDGCYSLYVHRDDSGIIDALEVTFIDEDDGIGEEEEDEE